MDILREAGIGGLYGLVGFAVMALGYLLLDLVTPGNLGRLIFKDRNRGGAVVLGGELIAIGLIVATAILTSEAGLANGLASTAAYGVVGLILMALVFALLGIATPGKMGATVLEDSEDGRPHPAAWVLASAYVGTALVAAAAIS